MSPWLATGVVLLLFGILIGCVWLCRRAFSWHPEISRKTVHVGMGVIALSFPWLFHHPVPVFAIAALASGVLLVLRRSGGTGGGLRSILHGVNRPSLGEFYFPLSICILFALAHERPVLFCIPVLILTLADAVAALIGVRYGAHKISTAEGQKSVEGSFSFWITAFLSTVAPLLLFTSQGLFKSLLIGMTLGLTVMVLEAIALHGRDNLYLPLGAYALLSIYVNLESAALAMRLVVLLALMAFVYVWRNRTALDDAALLGGALAGYVAWAIGGWLWLLPPLILVLTYTRVFPNPHTNRRGVHTIHAVVSTTGAGLLWLLLFARDRNSDYFYGYTLAWAAQLSLIGIASLAFRFPDAKIGQYLPRCVLWPFALLFIPYGLMVGPDPALIGRLACALALMACAAVLFYRIQPGIHDCPRDAERWIRQGSMAGIASLVGFLIVY